jgi:non-lysosomal glucosylceramidase
LTGLLDSLNEISFPNLLDGKPTAPGETVAGAVCVKITIPANSNREIVFSQSWDLPITRFGLSSYYKRYTRFYGKEARNDTNVIAQKIAIDGLNNYKKWENMIIEWQKPVSSDPFLPSWYKATLFNELYYVVDGGTVWTDGPKLGSNEKLDHDENGFLSMHFSYLEGHEYVMFNTYDVHFYASSALIMNWPELQLSLQRDFTRAIDIEHPEVIRWIGRGVLDKRKVKNTVPHDTGTTCEDPWNKVNSYQIQNTNRWKDLNCEYVISVWRDYTRTNDVEFLKFAWPRVQAVLEYHEKNYDKDGDGLIENEGFPDSTYDNWVTNGPSAYCGGLWIAAMAIGEQIALEIARLSGDDREALKKSDYYAKIKKKATEAYERLLWNDEGKYYNYEANKNSKYHNTVMSDQLCGHVHLLLTGVDTLLEKDRVHSALDKILELNVAKYKEITTLGGAVNGMRPNGEIDHHHVQTKEVWTGVTYLLAATLILEGRKEQAFDTAKGIYDTCWERLGYWFQTPEAYDEYGAYRSCAYMRPLGIWSIQHAWELAQKKK